MVTSVSAVALAAGFALAASLPSPVAAEGSSGRWSVELVTESGPCSARTSYAVTIEDGQVRLASDSAGARVSGRVGADGRVGLTVSNGTASGTGTGRLGGRSGAGTWTVSSLCSGRWTARRSDGRSAQAE